MATAIASAAADMPTATTTPKAANHLTPPPSTSTLTNGVANNSAMPVTMSAIAAMRIEKMLASFAGEDMIRSRSARV